MNKRLLRVAKYLSNNGLYKEAAELKKLAESDSEEDLIRGHGWSRSRRDPQGPMYDLFGGRAPGASGVNGGNIYTLKKDVELTEPAGRVIRPREGNRPQMYQFDPIRGQLGAVDRFDVFNVTYGSINHVGSISESDFYRQVNNLVNIGWQEAEKMETEDQYLEDVLVDRDDRLRGPNWLDAAYEIGRPAGTAKKASGRSRSALNKLAQSLRPTKQDIQDRIDSINSQSGMMRHSTINDFHSMAEGDDAYGIRDEYYPDWEDEDFQAVLRGLGELDDE